MVNVSQKGLTLLSFSSTGEIKPVVEWNENKKSSIIMASFSNNCFTFSRARANDVRFTNRYFLMIRVNRIELWTVCEPFVIT